MAKTLSPGSALSLQRREQLLKLGAVFGIVFFSGLIIVKVDDMLTSLVLAFVANYLLSPLVVALERRMVPRGLAIAIPFFFSGIVVFIGFFSILPLIISQAQSLATEFPRYHNDLTLLLANAQKKIEATVYIHNFDLSDTINSWLLSKSGEVSSALPGIVSHALRVALLAPMFAFFMIQDGPSIARSVLRMVPNNLFELALFLQHQINDQLGGFIRARFLEAAIVGLVVWLGLLVTGFPYATLLAAFAALTNLIPYVGPLIGAAPALLIALLSPTAYIVAPMSLNLIAVSSIYFVAQLIDVLFIIPFVVAKIVNLHPVIVIIAIIVGSQVMGILGMVISIPVASVLKVTLSAVYKYLLDEPQRLRG